VPPAARDARSAMTVNDFARMKKAGEKIAMVTCYDYTSALILNGAAADCLLVGDSLGMTMHGFSTTLPVTVRMMAEAVAAVARGAKNKFIIGDLPFASYRKSLSESVEAAAALMQAGAHAVKLEGAAGNAEAVKHLVESGIPVMGHIGLTPQFVNQLGGWRVQGKTAEGAKRLMAEAAALEKAGCFSIVIECVPAKVGKAITKKLKIPTIGIGAGKDTDGQVLVFQDLLGLNTVFRPKFVKTYLDGAKLIAGAVENYAEEVRRGKFPGDENSF
jgi:3-methyl-2-oxobutanoate hydroxymethyltransferase